MLKPRKLCGSCGVEKPLDLFYRKSSSKDGRQPHCRQCQSTRIAAHHKSDKGRAAQKRYRESPKGHARDARYNNSEKGRARIKRYQRTEKGKRAQKRYAASEKGRKAQRLGGVRRYAEAKEKVPKILDLYRLEEPETHREKQLLMKELERRKREVRHDG